MKSKSRAKTWIILILLFAGGYGWGKAWMRGRQIDNAQEELKLEKLARAGYQQAVERSTKRLGEELEALQGELKAAREAGAPPLVATRVVTKTVEVEVPIDRPVPVEVPCDAPETSPVAREEPGAMSLVGIGVGGTFEGLVTSTHRGEVLFTGKMFAHLSRLDWSRTVELPVDHTNSTVEVSKELTSALRYWYQRPKRFKLLPRKLRHWRVGPVLGAGACLHTADSFNYDLVRSGWDVSLCGFAGWGVQF